jgi:hypothetical protein
MPPNGLHAALVLSRKPHARILSIDDSVARSSPGFVGLFLAKDVPGDNMIGAVVADEELFAAEYITCVGQVSSLLNILSCDMFVIILSSKGTEFYCFLCVALAVCALMVSWYEMKICKVTQKKRKNMICSALDFNIYSCMN